MLASDRRRIAPGSDDGPRYREGGRARRWAVGAVLAPALLAGCEQPAPPPPAAVATPQFRELSNGSIVMVVPRTLRSDAFPALAKAQCADRPRCEVNAWISAADAPSALPLTETQVMTRAYSYISNRTTGFELSQWNCLMYERAERAQCMPDLED
ncbi:MAG: hypothetical protein ABW194_10045 [Novosphingobium sp.]